MQLLSFFFFFFFFFSFGPFFSLRKYCTPFLGTGCDAAGVVGACPSTVLLFPCCLPYQKSNNSSLLLYWTLSGDKKLVLTSTRQNPAQQSSASGLKTSGLFFVPVLGAYWNESGLSAWLYSGHVLPRAQRLPNFFCFDTRRPNLQPLLWVLVLSLSRLVSRVFCQFLVVYL